MTIDTKALKEQVQFRSDGDAKTIGDLCGELEAAREMTDRIFASHERAVAAMHSARAAAMEEAAQLAEDSQDIGRERHGLAHDIRALADKPPGVVCVKRTDLRRMAFDLFRVLEVFALGDSAESNTHYRIQDCIDIVDKALK